MPKESPTQKVKQIIAYCEEIHRASLQGALEANVTASNLKAKLSEFLIPKENSPEVLKAVDRAFKAFRLTPDNPDDHRKLLCFFAFAHFGPRGKTGPKEPTKWDIRKRVELGVQAEIVKEKLPTATNAEIAERVKRLWARPEREETILRYLNNRISGPRIKGRKARPKP
jgi:hypothetical protein